MRIVSNQIECASLSDNCFLIGEDLSCRQCKQGYFLINKTCQDCIDDCLVCFDYEICLQCKDHFVFDNSLKKCVENLTVAYFSDFDTFLSPFLSLNPSSSLLSVWNESLFFKRRDPDCTSFDVKGICVICRLGYYLGMDNNCHLCEEHCRVCKSKSLCVACKDQFDPIIQDNGYFHCVPKKVFYDYLILLFFNTVTNRLNLSQKTMDAAQKVMQNVKT